MKRRSSSANKCKRLNLKNFGLFFNSNTDKYVAISSAQEEALDYVSGFLKELTGQSGLCFNENQFRKIVKSLYKKLIKSKIQTGGTRKRSASSSSSPKTIELGEGSKPKILSLRQIGIDFAVILCFLLALILIITAFKQFDDLAKNTNLKAVAGELYMGTQDALQEVWNNQTKEERTFMVFVVDVLTKFKDNMVERQQTHLLNAIQTVLSSAAINIGAVAKNNCVTDLGGITGSESFDYFLNTASKIVNTYVNQNSIVSCTLQTASIETQRIMQERLSAFTLLSTKINNDVSQINNNIKTAFYLGGASMMYLTQRLGYITSRRLATQKVRAIAAV
jgi:hypothetical protein